mmetsp:Transcript_24506/g.68293  ORF Transcript_24506/g.68293 Transcript_24506/m.68293 type:complete len:302 (-) Transcript_24506:770-1675(-)
MDRPPHGDGARSRSLADPPSRPQRRRARRSRHPILCCRQQRHRGTRIRRHVLPVIRPANVAGPVHDHILQDRHHAQLRQPRAPRHLGLAGSPMRRGTCGLPHLHRGRRLQQRRVRHPILELLLRRHLHLLWHRRFVAATPCLHGQRFMGHALLDRLLLAGRAGGMWCGVLLVDGIPLRRDPVLHVPGHRELRHVRQLPPHHVRHAEPPHRLHSGSQVGTTVLHEADPRSIPGQHGDDEDLVGGSRCQHGQRRDARQPLAVRRPSQPLLHPARRALQARGRSHLQDVQRLVPGARQEVQQRP